MALTTNQQTAVELLFSGRFTLGQVAAKVGISERTLRRWQVEPEFASILAQGQQELFRRNRNHLLASAQGRLDSLLALHQELMNKKDYILANSDPLNVDHHRIYVSLVREVVRVEREIAKTLGQYTPSTPPPAEEVKRKPDLSCMKPDESMILEFFEHKISEANPWLESPCNRKLTQWDNDYLDRLVTNYMATQLDIQGVTQAGHAGIAIDTQLWGCPVPLPHDKPAALRRRQDRRMKLFRNAIQKVQHKPDP